MLVNISMNMGVHYLYVDIMFPLFSNLHVSCKTRLVMSRRYVIRPCEGPVNVCLPIVS